MLPVLVEVYSVERSFGTEVFPENVGDVAGTAGVSFDEDDFVPSENGNIARMLDGGDVSFKSKRGEDGEGGIRTMFDISAETFKLPIEIPEPTWLQTKFSTRA